MTTKNDKATVTSLIKAVHRRNPTDQANILLSLLMRAETETQEKVVSEYMAYLRKKGARRWR